MKLIGLSGAQGAGKSTLLAEMVSRGWKVDTFRVSRAVQAQLGWDTLERVMESPETMMEFQHEVLNQKYQNDKLLKTQLVDASHDQNDSVILTERTFADIFAYTAQWTWRFVDQGKIELPAAMEFMTDFTDRCLHAQNEIYAGALLLPYMEHMVWEDDANRAKLSDVDSVFANIERFQESCLSRRQHIRGKTVHERADEVQTFLETM